MTTGKKTAPSVSKELNSQLQSLPTKSSMIRLLSSKGYNRADISRILNIRYQHVKNVLDNPPKKNNNEQ